MQHQKIKQTNPLGLLFARYLDGQIEESLWKRFMSVLESFESDPRERTAFITFVDDILRGTGDRSAPQLNRLLAEAVEA